MEFQFDSDIPPAIPDGEDYEVKFVGAEQSHQWNSEKVFLWFELLTPGEWVGTHFFMACNAKPDGRWGPAHKYLQAWILANGAPPKRRDRMSTKVFRDKVFRARVRKVTQNANKTSRTPAQQYSVIAELLEQVRGAADVSCNSVIGRVDSLPAVGVGAGKSTRASQSTRKSDGISAAEYRRKMQEWKEEYWDDQEVEEEEDEDE